MKRWAVRVRLHASQGGDERVIEVATEKTEHAILAAAVALDDAKHERWTLVSVTEVTS